jgi:hypothetical protein
MPPNYAIFPARGVDNAPLALTTSAAGYAADEKAAATRLAYRSDWRHFRTWCENAKAHPLPASPAHQNHGVRFGAYSDAHKRLSAVGPRIRKVFARMEPSLPMPAADVYRRAALAGRASTYREQLHNRSRANAMNDHSH